MRVTLLVLCNVVPDRFILDLRRKVDQLILLQLAGLQTLEPVLRYFLSILQPRYLTTQSKIIDQSHKRLPSQGQREAEEDECRPLAINSAGGPV